MNINTRKHFWGGRFFSDRPWTFIIHLAPKRIRVSYRTQLISHRYLNNINFLWRDGRQTYGLATYTDAPLLGGRRVYRSPLYDSSLSQTFTISMTTKLFTNRSAPRVEIGSCSKSTSALWSTRYRGRNWQSFWSLSQIFTKTVKFCFFIRENDVMVVQFFCYVSFLGK